MLMITRSGSSDLSPDRRYLATLNIRQGIAMYDMQTREICMEALLDQGSSAAPLPILYIHKGNAVVTGTKTGKVRIWNADGKQPFHMQKLVHGNTLHSLGPSQSPLTSCI